MLPVSAPVMASQQFLKNDADATNEQKITSNKPDGRLHLCAPVQKEAECSGQCALCALWCTVFDLQFVFCSVLCTLCALYTCAKKLCSVQVCLRKLGNQFVQVTQLQTRTGHYNYLLVSHNTNQIQTVRFV